MALIIEDGSGVEGANSYVTEAEFTTYLLERGITLVGPLNAEQLLIRAMDYIESLSYWGNRVSCEQTLSWPRYWVPIEDCCYFPGDTIPPSLKKAQMQVAASIDLGVDPLATIPRLISSVTVGPISITYEKGSNAPIIRSVDAYLSRLVRVGSMSFRVSRGA